MEFDITKTEVEKENLELYEKEAIKISEKFAENIIKEFGNFVKVVALFGSSDTERVKKGSDIDILIVLDDVSVVLTKELVEAYRILIEKIVANVSLKIHVTTMRMTSYWEYVRAGDPIMTNILRSGVAIIDTGIFMPLQILLKQGRIRPSPESVWAYFIKSPVMINNSKWHVMQAVLDLYWAVVDSAHAALMKLGEIPPSPEHLSEMLTEKMVKKGILDARYPKIMNRFYQASRMITHREVKEISGEEFDKYLIDAQDFVDVMKMFIEGRIFKI